MPALPHLLLLAPASPLLGPAAPLLRQVPRQGPLLGARGPLLAAWGAQAGARAQGAVMAQGLQGVLAVGQAQG